jgi:hypothetical protein
MPIIAFRIPNPEFPIPTKQLQKIYKISAVSAPLREKIITPKKTYRSRKCLSHLGW